MWSAQSSNRKISWGRYLHNREVLGGDRLYLYRGQGDSAWSPYPALFRRKGRYDSIGERRRKLNVFFQLVLPEFISEYCVLRGIRDSSMYDMTTWIGIAQHNGLRTPLLDWTESPFIALYFAVQQWDHKAPAVRIIRLDVDLKDKEDRKSVV